MENTNKKKKGGIGKWVVLAIAIFILISTANEKDTKTLVQDNKLPEQTTSINIPPMNENSENDILVKSEVNKKVDGKYRYFFIVTNNKKTDLRGFVRIKLLKSEGLSPLQDFNLNDDPIKTNRSKAFFIETSTSPNQLIGTFEYIVYDEKGFKEIVKGEDLITSKSESL